MTNADTISKLNNALHTLIKAYEELQLENNNNKERIAELEDEVFNLELVKEGLDKEVYDLRNNTEQDKSNITSMLGKIEDILNKKDELPQYVSFSKKEEKVKDIVEKEQEVKEEEIAHEDSNKEEIEATNLLNSFENVLNKKDEQKDDNKLDLTRMSSLLNGFHN